jgi:hypothetical protein
MFYTLNIYNFICQLYFTKTGRGKFLINERANPKIFGITPVPYRKCPARLGMVAHICNLS